MDPTPWSAVADRPTRIEAILERARRLSGADIAALAAAYRGARQPGEHDPLASEHGRRRAQVISIAVARSGRVQEAREVRSSAAAAVRSAAGQAGEAGALDALGLLYDAELAATDAALAVLLEDHLSAEIAAFLAEPFQTATAARAADVTGTGR
jgi:hypothetical protein